MKSGVTVCLYSKYSEQCVLFFEDMAYLKGIRMLCIDNENVRRLIENDDCKYDIKEVPTILIFYKNGRMDKYEGEDAFTWLYDRKKKMMMSSNMIISSLTNESNENEDHSVATEIKPIKRIEVRNMNPTLPEDPFPLTPPSSSSLEKEDISISQQPLVGHTPGDPVSVDIPESERMPFENKSSSNILKKKENIMSIAMSMAKQRESEFEANDPKKKIQDSKI